MKEIAVCALSLLLFSTTNLIQETATQTYTIVVKNQEGQALVDTQYQVYLDAEGKKPYLDPQEQPLFFHSELEGKSSLELEEGNYYLKMVKPSNGYYYEDEIIPLETKMTFTLEPITYTSLCGDRDCKVQWKKENEIVEETNLQAGMTYTVQEKDVENYIYGLPQEVEIPRVKPKEEIFIQLKEEMYSEIEFTIQTEDQLPSIFTTTLYQDESCKKIAQDIEGQDIILNTSESDTFKVRLQPNTYFLKFENIDAKYNYLENQKIVIEPQQSYEQTIELSLMKLKVKFVDGDNQKDMNVCAKLEMDEKKETGNLFQVERGQKGTLQLEKQLPYTFDIKPILIEVDEKQTEDLEVTVPLYSFEIKVEGVDSNTDTTIPFTYELVDEKGNQKKDVYAGETVYIHETTCLDGYELLDTKELTIDQYQSSKKSYQVNLKHQGYVYASIQSDVGSVVGLYVDEGCRQVAYDRFGNQAIKKVGAYGKVTFEMKNGTYYARTLQANDGYWKNISVKKLSCYRYESLNQETKLFNTPIVIYFESTNEDVSDVKYQIFSGQQLLATTSEKLIGLVNPNQVIRICPINMNGQYVYEREKEIQIPATYEEINVSFDFEPYTNLQLSSNVHEPIQTTIYRDEKMTEIAKDINGNECIFDLSQIPEKIKLFKGNYWIVTEQNKQYYSLKENVLVDCKQPLNSLNLELKGVEVVVESEESNSNVTMELLDSTGHLLKTWVNEGSTKLDTKELEIGESYTIKERDSQQETTFEVTNEENQEGKVVKVPSKEEKTEPKPYWILIVGILGFVCIVLGILLFRKNNEICYKE